MPGLGKGLAVVARFIRILPGGSQPALVQATDSEFYVLKFLHNLQGPNLVFNEVMGSELLQACGLPVPPWKPLLLTDEFLDQNPGCWSHSSDGPIRPQAGLCFGSRYLATETAETFNILPASRFARIRNRSDFWMAWIVDVCARHTDHRQAIFIGDASKSLRAVFVDQGCMFGGATGGQKFCLDAPRYLDRRIYPAVAAQFREGLTKFARNLDLCRVWKMAAALPPDWKTDSGFHNLALCLQALGDSCQLPEIFDTLRVSVPVDCDAPELHTRPTCTLLYAGVHAS